MNSYFTTLKKYTDFTGRSSRKEYWFFVFINAVFSIVLYLVDLSIGTYNPHIGLGVLGGLFGLAVLLPSIAVSVRRLHDTERSGNWMFILLVPFLGPVIFLYFMAQGSSVKDADWGAASTN